MKKRPLLYVFAIILLIVVIADIVLVTLILQNPGRKFFESPTSKPLKSFAQQIKEERVVKTSRLVEKEVEFKVRGFYHPDDETGYFRYKAKFKLKNTDILKMFPEKAYENGTYSGVEIETTKINLKITADFEGIQVTHFGEAQKPSAVKIDDIIFSKEPVHRLKFKHTEGNRFDYVTKYKENCNDKPELVCHAGKVVTEETGALNISCTSEPENVIECDDIVKNFTMEVVSPL